MRGDEPNPSWIKVVTSPEGLPLKRQHGLAACQSQANPIP